MVQLSDARELGVVDRLLILEPFLVLEAEVVLVRVLPVECVLCLDVHFNLIFIFLTAFYLAI